MHSVALNRQGDTLAVGTANETEVYSLRTTPRHAEYLKELEGNWRNGASSRRWRGLRGRAASPSAHGSGRITPGSSGRSESRDRKGDRLFELTRQASDVAGLQNAFTAAKARNSRASFSGAPSATRVETRFSKASGDANNKPRISLFRSATRTLAHDTSFVQAEWPDPLYACEPLALYPDLLAQQGNVALSDHLLAVGAAKRITVVDLNTGATILKNQRMGRVRCVTLSSGGVYVCSGSFDSTLELVDMTAGARLHHHNTVRPRMHMHALHAPALSTRTHGTRPH